MRGHDHPGGTATDSDVVSERDLELIHALQDDPRGSWQDLARRVGVSPHMLSHRWDRLWRERLAWLAIYPSRRWWAAHQLAFVEAPVTPDTIDAVAAEVAADRSVLSVDVSASSVLASIAGRDYASVGQDLLSGRHHGAAIHWAVELHSHASWWRVGSALKELPRRPDTVRPGAPNEDRVRELLRVLGPNPRLPARQVAAECGISDWAAREWIRRALTYEDMSIRCDVVPPAVGQPVSLHWWLDVTDTDAATLVELLLAQRFVRWVISVDSTTDATLLTALWLPNPAAGRDLTRMVAREVPHARTVRRVYQLRPVKRAGWLIDPVTGRRGAYVPLDV